MGWRAEKAYDELLRDDWRRFLAAQPLWRRLVIRAWQCLLVGAILAIVAGPFLAGVLRGFF